MSRINNVLDINNDYQKVENASLAWLADAPLFVDGVQIDQLYDAIVRPDDEESTRCVTFSDGVANEIGKKIGIEGSVSPGSLTSIFSKLFSFEAKISGELAKSEGKSSQVTDSLEMKAIKTPQRRLVHLIAHYLFCLRARLFWNNDANWKSPESAAAMPRGIVFLDLPGCSEVEEDQVETKLIPMAAEYENGEVVRLYEQIKGERGDYPPEYSIEKREEYWRFYEINFSTERCMEIIENSSALNGRLRWIDFRLPLTKSGGEVLHLHFQARGDYDTGTFAYNLIRRGHKHGLRVVGTLRSGLALNVLAVYEK